MGGIAAASDQDGKEVVATWGVSDFDNQGVFYTDSNSLEMQRRQRDFRPTFELRTDEPVSGNYYPVNTAIAIRDSASERQLTVMNDRSQGGASLANNRVELMQNRRLFFDDARGVEEALNEVDARGDPI